MCIRDRFGVIGILAALQQRHLTGRGQKVTSALFETTVYLVGQHMAQLAVTGQAARPMPVRVSAWAIYDVFQVKGGEQVFVGVVSDAQWQSFCSAFDFAALGADPRYRTNSQPVSYTHLDVYKRQVPCWRADCPPRSAARWRATSPP